jgi:NTP pyrophosphatase (non-canonical NTP hydrolase)
MNMNDRVEQAVKDSSEWFSSIKHDATQLPLWLLCLGGETGELQNKAKKWLRGSYTYDEVRPLLADELVDVFVYAFNVAAALDIDLEKEYDIKRRHNQARFGSRAGTHRGTDSVAEGSGSPVRRDVPAATRHGSEAVRHLHVP